MQKCPEGAELGLFCKKCVGARVELGLFCNSLAGCDWGDLKLGSFCKRGEEGRRG